MSDLNLVINYFGHPPYYRYISTGDITKLPFRIRLSDGSTLTDPSQWGNDPVILASAGYEETQITQEDLDKRILQLTPIIPELTFEQSKQNMLNLLDSHYNNLFKQGWQTPEGWYLGATTEDVSLLTGAFVLLKESVALGLGDTFSIIDTDQVSHVVDLQTMTQLMLGYGQFRSQLSDNYAITKTEINNATNNTELELINITGEEI